MKKNCYICGKEGADSKDHLPPKCFLNSGNYNDQNRITIPAHKNCNNSYSKDEEYVKDAIISTSQHIIDIDELWKKTKRGLSRKESKKKLKNFLKDSKPIEEITNSGIITGRKGVLLKIDSDRFERVGKKIVKGLLFHDLAKVFDLNQINGYFISNKEFRKIRDEGLSKKIGYWRYMTSPKCHHEVINEYILFRRHYVHLIHEEKSRFEGYFAIGLYDTIFCYFIKIDLEKAGKACNHFRQNEKVTTIDF